MKIAIEPPDAPRFRSHSMTLCCGGKKWVRASGVEGIRKLTVRLAPDGDKLRPYTVRLHFREPSGALPGARVFSVAVQGKMVLKDMDIARRSRHGHLVEEVKGVTGCNTLTIELTPTKGQPVLCGVEAIVQP
ncbi:MAG: hypothetical protein GY700_06970 [Propionibacteriaceae bacterium]|nr:hypothetical protein [Propionibacteriaceae bacterium]